MDTEKLIERLREIDISWSETGELAAEAADALEASTRRVKETEEVRDWLASCTVATAISLAGRKSTPKGELKRQDSILEKLEAWLADDFSRFPAPMPNPGLLDRIRKARTTLSQEGL